jgi:hypothetical protein
MRRRLARAVIAVGMSLVAFAAAAQPLPGPLPDDGKGPPDEILHLSGGWELKTEDGKHSCLLTLTARRIPAGYVLVQKTPCTDPVLYMDEAVAWQVNPESLQLVTVTGAAVSTFFPERGRLYTRTDPVLLLVSTDKQGEGTL